MKKRNHDSDDEYSTTPKEVAQWMLEEINKANNLYQSDAAAAIKTKFGERFCYINQNGNLAVDRKVLNEFKKLTGNLVVWDRNGHLWRLREDYDTPTRRQN